MKNKKPVYYKGLGVLEIERKDHVKILVMDGVQIVDTGKWQGIGTLRAEKIPERKRRKKKNE